MSDAMSDTILIISSALFVVGIGLLINKFRVWYRRHTKQDGW